MGNIQSSTLRQPSSPGHHGRGGALMDPNSTLKEANSEMRGRSCRNCHYYLERCKKSLTNIDSLPDDVVFNILVQLPAQYLYDVARLVCRKWHYMIHTHNFISEHLRCSITGLIIERGPAIKPPIFAAIQQGQIEISNFTHKFKDTVRGGCNGLILQSGVWHGDLSALYIANPATKQLFKLPPIRCGLSNYFNISFAVKCIEYKVVHMYNTCKDNVICAILTVGVNNSWRHVNVKHLSIEAQRCLVSYPLASDGFIHWAVQNTHVLTLNIETEIITQTLAPQICGEYPYLTKKHPSLLLPRHLYVCYLSSERYLSLLVPRDLYLLEVWEMKPESGEWRKLRNTDLEALKCTFNKFPSGLDWPPRPVGWLKYGEVLVFSGCGGPDSNWVWIAYNLLTKEIDVFELDPVSDRVIYKFLVHRESLVWFGGCQI